jgi:hypothetical protein
MAGVKQKRARSADRGARRRRKFTVWRCCSADFGLQNYIQHFL